WAPGVSEYSGETYELSACYSNPKPVQKPHPPIYFGGETHAAMRRVASHGNGWYGFNRDPAGTREGIARLTEHLRAAGRSRSDVQVCIGANSQPVTRETVPRYEDEGVDQLLVPLVAGKIDKLKMRVEEMLKVISP
ncbi:MAG: LLM class flavin-dependent oxidoreductase, partial [Gammaproteobacteria bacterium]|nr:LLM class flavin-dependent oxidoreductase [Gammaproteobacteria bacterium]